MRGYLVNACDITEARHCIIDLNQATHTHTQSCLIRIFQSVLLDIVVVVVFAIYYNFFYSFVFQTS